MRTDVLSDGFILRLIEVGWHAVSPRVHGTLWPIYESQLWKSDRSMMPQRKMRISHASIADLHQGHSVFTAVWDSPSSLG
ncbi:hypothetical protein R3I93_012245 [Phoxinus phoxinus]|uniref:Uncharacterized protein n=1 Tax=Phoxinus phoxinus TaxID=58324 RepID=A0AAN9H562_9TELE